MTLDNRLHRVTEVPCCTSDACACGDKPCPTPQQCRADLDDMFDTARGIVWTVVVLLLSIAASAVHPGPLFGG